MIAFTIHRSGKGHYLQAKSVKYTSTDLALLKSQSVKVRVMNYFIGTCHQKGKKKGHLPLPLTQNLYWEPTDRWLVTSSQPLLVSRHVFSQTSFQPRSQCSCTVSSQYYKSRLQTSPPRRDYSQDSCADLHLEAAVLLCPPCHCSRCDCCPGRRVAPPQAGSAHQTGRWVQAQVKQQERWSTAGMKAVGRSFQQKLRVGPT